MPHSCVEIDDDLMEWDYGVYEGRRTVDIEVERPGWRLFRDGCPGGETLDAVGARADRVVCRIRASGGNMLLFAHREILRILAMCVFQPIVDAVSAGSWTAFQRNVDGVSG